jgi:hypothetical protein
MIAEVGTAPSRNSERGAVKGPKNPRGSKAQKVSTAESSLRTKKLSSRRPINPRLGQPWHKIQSHGRSPPKDRIKSTKNNLPIITNTLRRITKITITKITKVKSSQQVKTKSINLKTRIAGIQSRTRTPNLLTTTLRILTPVILITKAQEMTMKSNTIVAKTKLRTPGSRITL